MKVVELRKDTSCRIKRRQILMILMLKRCFLQEQNQFKASYICIEHVRLSNQSFLALSTFRQIFLDIGMCNPFPIQYLCVMGLICIQSFSLYQYVLIYKILKICFHTQFNANVVRCSNAILSISEMSTIQKQYFMYCICLFIAEILPMEFSLFQFV